MISGKRVLAIVPARGGSKGLERKNIRPMAGSPLVTWPIRAALNSSFVDRVICSTDDREIASVANQGGADVPFIRPDELAGDLASSADVVIHALDELAKDGDIFDYVVLLEPTSPLTTNTDIDQALKSLDDSRNHADAIVGISRVEATHPDFDVRRGSDGIITPYAAKDFSSLKRRQDVEELYFLDGSLYISDVQVFISRRSFYHERTMGQIMPRWKSFEIDEYIDFVCVEAILDRQSEFESTDS